MFDDSQHGHTDDAEDVGPGQTIISPRNVEGPPEGYEDVIEHAARALLAFGLRPGDMVQNGAVCVLVGLPQDAHINDRRRLRQQYVRLVYGSRGRSGLLDRLAEMQLPLRPANSRFTVMNHEETMRWRGRRGLRDASKALARETRFIRHIRPESAEESRQQAEELNRLGAARQGLLRSRRREEKLKE